MCGEQDCFYLLWFRLFFNSSMYLICYLLGSTEQRWGESETNKGLAWNLPDGTSLSSGSIWGAFYLFWSRASGLLPSEASKMCFFGVLWQNMYCLACFFEISLIIMTGKTGTCLHQKCLLLIKEEVEQGSAFCLVDHIPINCVLLLLIMFTVKNFLKLLTINSHFGMYFILHLCESYKKSD